MADTQLMTTEVHYPETDGKPMAETETHLDQMMDLIHCLRKWFRDDPQVYVAGNLLFYYEEGDPQASVAPDVFVVRGVEKHRRRVYKLWEEGKGPDLVIEITSRSTKLEDLGNKKALYAEMGVREYLIHDPLGEWLTPALALYRLKGREYVPIEAGAERLASEVTGLEFDIVEGFLRVFDPATGKMLPTSGEEGDVRTEAEMARAEAEMARAEAERERDRETEARREAEAEVERLRRQLADRDK